MRWIARHLRSTLLMLLMAAFVVVPVADVLACAVEPHSVAAHVDVTAGESDSDNDGDGKHVGACSHNHCHHSNLSLPASTLAAFGTPLPARWMQGGDLATYAVAQEELARPPRA